LDEIAGGRCKHIKVEEECMLLTLCSEILLSFELYVEVLHKPLCHPSFPASLWLTGLPPSEKPPPNDMLMIPGLGCPATQLRAEMMPEVGIRALDPMI
jgi:hypothetical protein